MREIKFRGFNNFNNGWIYGSLVEIYEDCHILKEGKTFFDRHTKVDKESIGQYTGLKDKDGKEIYEGDILLQSRSYIPENNIKHRVEFSEEFCGFVAVPMEGEVYRDSALCLSEVLIYREGFRIIGNIFENKELLKTE